MLINIVLNEKHYGNDAVKIQRFKNQLVKHLKQIYNTCDTVIKFHTLPDSFIQIEPRDVQVQEIVRRTIQHVWLNVVN